MVRKKVTHDFHSRMLPANSCSALASSKITSAIDPNPDSNLLTSSPADSTALKRCFVSASVA